MAAATFNKHGIEWRAAAVLRVKRRHREPRVGFALHRKTLRVCEVPMERVELSKGHGIDKFEHVADGDEVPRRIDHDAPMREPRRVGDRHTTRYGASGRHELAERLQSSEHTPTASASQSSETGQHCTKVRIGDQDDE